MPFFVLVEACFSGFFCSACKKIAIFCGGRVVVVEVEVVVVVVVVKAQGTERGKKNE
jgi:hypothetical protein